MNWSFKSNNPNFWISKLYLKLKSIKEGGDAVSWWFRFKTSRLVENWRFLWGLTLEHPAVANRGRRQQAVVGKTQPQLLEAWEWSRFTVNGDGGRCGVLWAGEWCVVWLTANSKESDKVEIGIGIWKWDYRIWNTVHKVKPEDTVSIPHRVGFGWRGMESFLFSKIRTQIIPILLKSM